ncbi:hypothetical protein DCS_02020 [Drechmeria coniospora]|uniref:Uncharacterized protein n=1 Tax=Drechmeria coniospora TaxID=98403 RepID=A0A151GUY5_DRECN|nr:hypothetical protein DCS_02020 [Drechmeria coniospora]KYK60881.1 hypothetical protein DCS_02020 [Drechmeria coniospora]
MKLTKALFFATVTSAGIIDKLEFPEAKLAMVNISSAVQSFRAQVESGNDDALPGAANAVLQTIHGSLLAVTREIVTFKEETARVMAADLQSLPQQFASLQGPLRNKRSSLARANACGSVCEFLDDCARLTAAFFRSLAWRMPEDNSKARVAAESHQGEFIKVMDGLKADFVQSLCLDVALPWSWLSNSTDRYLYIL